MEKNIQIVPKGHIVLTVKNLKKSFIWYNDFLKKLGFKVSYKNLREHVYFENKDFPFYIAIAQGDKNFLNSKHERYAPGFNHLALRVKNKGDVDDIFSFLKRKKVVFDGLPENYPEYSINKIYYAVFLYDPDGLTLEIFYEE